MTRWYVCLICGAFIFAGLFGCTEEPSPAPQPQQSVAVQTPLATPVPAPAMKQEKEVADFLYVTEGRRDPFVPLSKIRSPFAVTTEPLTPLQTYDLTQFRLVGVIVGKGAPKAMVVAPDGKSYVLAKGVKIGKNNGVVTKISGSVILVQEKYYDFSGNVIENIQEIAVPKREGV
ncbi:MAG: pilus assembly protein PilP [Desulfuromonadales bacterium]